MDRVILELRNSDELDLIMDGSIGQDVTLVRCLWQEKKHDAILITDENQARYVEKNFQRAVVRRLSQDEARKLLYEQARSDYLYGRKDPDGPGPRAGATGRMWRRYLSVLSEVDEELARSVLATWRKRSTEWRDKLQSTQETDSLIEGGLKR